MAPRAVRVDQIPGVRSGADGEAGDAGGLAEEVEGSGVGSAGALQDVALGANTSVMAATALGSYSSRVRR